MAQTHHYLFDTATGFADSTGSINFSNSLGTINASGKINQAFRFEYLAMMPTNTASNLLPTSGAFTIAFWMNENFGGYAVTLFTVGDMVVQLDGKFQQLSVVRNMVGGFTVPKTAGSFVHYIVSTNGSGTWTVYKNNVLQTITGTQFTPSASTYSSMSSFSFNGGSNGDPIFFDDLRIYDEVIDSTERAFIYNSGTGTQSDSGGGGGSGGLGTNLFVNNILSQPAKLTNSTTIVWSTNSNGDIVATATNIAGTTTDNVWQVWGGANFIITNSASAGDIKASTLTFSGGITNATLIGSTGAGDPAIVRFDFASRNTNYFVVLEIESEVGASFAVGGLNYNTKSTNSFEIWLTAPFASDYSGGYWTRVRMMDQVSVGGSGGDVTQSGNNTFTGTNTFSGTTTFNDLAIGTITVVSNLTVPNNTYGAGWNGSTNVPNENSVYDEMELRAPKASPSFTGVATNTGSFGAPTLYVGSTNVAVALASVGGSGLTNGGTIASGTITNLTSQSISIGGETRTNWPGYSLRFDEQYTGFANGFNAVASANPFTGNSYITATATYLPSEMNHNGIVRLATGATANSLYYFLGAYGPSADGVAISGGEAFETVFRVVSTNGLRISFGFHDNSTVAYAGTDVVSIRTGRNSGEWNVLEGVCRFNSTETATSTSYSIQTNVWYIASGYIATNLSTANFSLRLFSDNSVLWTNSVSTNIPNGNTRLTAGLFGASSTNGSTTLIDLDSIYLRLRGQ